MKRNTLLIVAAVIIVATLFGDWLIGKVSKKDMLDTKGVVIGMTYGEYTEISGDGRLDFYNYSFFVNDDNYPVLVRFEENKVAEVHALGAIKAAAKEKQLEKITVGMNLTKVSQMVGAPVGIAKVDENTLFYNLKNETAYLIRFALKDNVLYVENITTESME